MEAHKKTIQGADTTDNQEKNVVEFHMGFILSHREKISTLWLFFGDGTQNTDVGENNPGFPSTNRHTTTTGFQAARN